MENFPSTAQRQNKKGSTQHLWLQSSVTLFLLHFKGAVKAGVDVKMVASTVAAYFVYSLHTPAGCACPHNGPDTAVSG